MVLLLAIDCRCSEIAKEVFDEISSRVIQLCEEKWTEEQWEEFTEKMDDETKQIVVMRIFDEVEARIIHGK